NTILEAKDGSVWTGSVLGVGHWVQQSPSKSLYEESMQSVLTLTEDARGRIWVGSADHGLRFFSDGRWQTIHDDELLKRNIHAIAFTPDGDIWVGTGHGLRRYSADGVLKKVFLSHVRTRALLTDRHGALWVGTSGLGLARFQNEEFQHFSKAD